MRQVVAIGPRIDRNGLTVHDPPSGLALSRSRGAGPLIASSSGIGLSAIKGLRDQRSLPIQIRDEIRALIAAGTLRPGDPLPGEAELAARFSVARPTLREALKLLEQDGEVEVRHGLGRFVAPAVVRWPITRLESVGNMLHAMGSTVTTRVVSVEPDEASEDEATELGLQVGSRVVRLLRIRLLDGHPAVYSSDVVPGWVVDDDISAVDWTGSLRSYLEVPWSVFLLLTGRHPSGHPASVVCPSRWREEHQRTLAAADPDDVCPRRQSGPVFAGLPPRGDLYIQRASPVDGDGQSGDVMSSLRQGLPRRIRAVAPASDRAQNRRRPRPRSGGRVPACLPQRGAVLTKVVAERPDSIILGSRLARRVPAAGSCR